MTDNHANSEADRSGRATAPSLRTRIAAIIAKMNDCWCEDCHVEPDNFDLLVADKLIRELELQYEYENGRVMYTTKPAACKANGNWQVRIASPFKLYEGES